MGATIRKRGPSYYIRVTRGRGEPEQWIRAGATKREANAALARIKAELARADGATLPAPSARPVRFVDLAERWWREYALVHVTENTRRPYRSELAAVKEWFPTDRAADIGLAELDEMVAALVQAGAAPETTRRRVTRVKQVLRWGHARGLVPQPPPPVKTPPRKRQRQPLPLRPDELARLLAACDQPWAALFAMMALHGHRPGEARAQRWQDIRHGRVHIVSTIDSADLEHEPKASGTRAVPLDPVAAALLDELPRDDPRVFPGLDREEANAELRAAVARAGIPGEGRILYDLRHTYATLAILLGVGPATLARRMGNSVQVCMSRYVAWFEDLAPDADVVISSSLPSGIGRGTWPTTLPARWEKPAQTGFLDEHHGVLTTPGRQAKVRPSFKLKRPRKRYLPAKDH